MKIKNSTKVEVNQPISSPILKSKERKCKLEEKRKFKRLVKVSSQNWEVTNSVHAKNTTTYSTEDISTVNVQNKSKKRKRKINLPHNLKTTFELSKANLHETPSIVKMSSGPILVNVLKNKFSDDTHNRQVDTSLKCLMSTAGHDDPSSLMESNHMNFCNKTKGVPIQVHPDEVSPPLKFNDKQFPNNKFTNIDGEKGPRNQQPKEYSLVVNLENKIISVADFHELSGMRYLVVMKPDCHFYFAGIIEIELLKGSIEILGYKLNRQMKKILVFSTQGSSHLCIKTKKCNDNFLQTSKPLSVDQLLLLGLSEEKSTRLLKEAQTCILIIISRKRTDLSSSVWPKLFENHHSFCIFPPNDLLIDERRPCHDIERQLGCILDVNLNSIGLKEFLEVPEWSLAVEDITSNDWPRTILCGGKSVGKSTLLRYLINKCLQKWNRVLVLDFDLGQCEFTIGGCVSVVLVEDPILGPNYTHLKQPLRSVFLGEIDVTKCPENYIEGCKSLIEFAKQNYGTIPWLINTMGFTRGFGVTLTCGIIKSVKPTHVIEIQSISRKLNFPSSLNPGFVHCQNVGAFNTDGDLPNYKFFTIRSGAEQKGNNSSKARGMSPAEARNLVVLSYFSKMLTPEMSNLAQVTPYMINMDQVDLQITNKYKFNKAQLAATMNGNLVALCTLNEGDRFPHCPGFGIVRGIDQHTGTIYLITPMRCDTLRKINCLVKGNISLPESLYFGQRREVDGLIPYLAHTSGQSTSRFAKRDFRTLPVNQRQQQK
uniref:Polynucleotide 5'-hydroxyl-kinase NOL9 n=1 Tax=Graphocephala atropunctata TaxID=36148 RepID=A0A1B6LQG1_9HEMI